jgi:hypothetical protein
MEQTAMEQFLSELDKALNAMPAGVAKPYVPSRREEPMSFAMRFPDRITPSFTFTPMPDTNSDVIEISSSFFNSDWTNDRISIRRDGAEFFMIDQHEHTGENINLNEFSEDLLRRLNAESAVSS